MSKAQGQPIAGSEIELQQLNPKKLSLSVIPAFFIFIAGGMNLALGLGWNIDTLLPSTKHFASSFFIGVIIGALLAAPLITLLPKLLYILISALLMLIDGIIFTSAPFNFAGIIAARYLDGIAMGFTAVAFIVHISELVSKVERGNCLAIEQYGITLGIAVQVIYSTIISYDGSIAPNRLHGILTIICSLLSIASLPFITESPIYHLRKTDNTGRRMLVHEEVKFYFLFNENLSLGDSFKRGLIPLFKMVLYRALLAFCFSLPLSGAIEVATLISQGYDMEWPFYIYGIVRLLGGALAISLFDSMGRKTLALISLLIMAGLSIGIGIIFNDAFNLTNLSQMSTVCGLACGIQFCAAFFTSSSTVYLGEAFPMKAKPYFIAFAIIIEQLVHIIVVCTFVFTPYNAFCYFIAVGVIMFVCCILFVITVPETKRTSLLEAQENFRAWINWKFT